MTDITDLSPSQLTHNELAETTNNYLTVIQTHLADNTFLTALVALIVPALEKMRSALSAIRTNNLVKQAFKLDQMRDNLFVIFRDMVAAFKKTDVSEEQEAYEQLWPIFEKVGVTLYLEGYLEQSGRLEVLFQEMDKPENRSAMETLGVTPRYTRLKDAEADFKNIYNERLDEDAKKSYPTLREARLALAPLVADLIPTLRNVARTAEEGADTGWTGLIDEQTSRVMTQVAARRTRQSAEEEGSATEESADAGGELNEEAAE